jgi:tetratricopeptide (TPR) repeat protein
MPLDVVPVFVSSTWLDLRPEREAVRDAVLRMKETQFVGMEYFGSRDETTHQASLDEVDRSELYVGIFAARHGSGITEAEYRRARSRGLPCLIYFKSDAVALTPDQQETDADKSARLATLKRELRASHTVKQFNGPDDLAAQLATDLHRWLFDNYLPTNLQGALRGEVSHDEAQALLDAVKDLRGLKQDLLDSLRGAGFNVASGERSAAVSGDKNRVVTGDANVFAENVTGDVVHGDKIVNEASRPIIPTLHQLRAPVGDFVGREKEIDELLATLRGGGSAAINGISGMGGIGKTELSFYVAERLRDTYPDAQLVLDMRGTDDPPRDPSDALASCIRAFLGLEYKPPDDLVELTHLYRTALEGKRALILLDNAHDSAQVRPLLPPHGSALLITSRNRIVLPGMKSPVTLDQLSPAEARELLTGIAPRVPSDIADQICYLCGYLPLALRAAGSLLAVTDDLDPSDYATQLSDERTRLEHIGTEGVDVSVEASFNLSYARLSPDAARVFRQLAVFPATFDAVAEEAVCEDPGHKHLSDLLRRSLVLYNPDTRRYRLHDLARLFADSRLSDEERNASQMRHATQHLRVFAECNNLYLDGGETIKSGLALFDTERQNIEAGQKWAREYSSVDKTAAYLCNQYAGVGIFVLWLRQHRRECLLWIEAALVAAQQLNDRAAEGVHLGNLGNAFQSLGELRQAVEFYEQALRVFRELGDRRWEGAVLGNLGVIHADLDEPHRAIEFYKQGLVIAREVGDRRGETTVLAGLGGAHAALQDVHHAVELYEQGLAVAREIGDQLNESYMLGNLGNLYLRLGDTSQAVELFNNVLTVAREMGDQYSEANALYAISRALDALDDRSKAIAYAEAALEISERIESPNAIKMRAQLAEWRGEATGGE